MWKKTLSIFILIAVIIVGSASAYALTKHHVTIKIDERVVEINTHARTVDDVLTEIGLKFEKYDVVTPTRKEEVIDGLLITYQSAILVTVFDNNRKKTYHTIHKDFSTFLKKEQISLDQYDQITRQYTGKLRDEEVITITRIKKEWIKKQENIPFAVEKRQDPTLPKGKQKVMQQGKVGTKEILYEETFKNGIKVNTKKVSETIKIKPTTTIILVGTKVIQKQTKVKQETRGSTSTKQTITQKKEPNVSPKQTDVTKEMTVKATAYTANCTNCSGITATGINLKKNPTIKVISVDPNVIPLGTKVWVEGYGEAIAADTGGAIKGNKIDVFFSSKEKALHWGVKQNVKIKILK